MRGKESLKDNPKLIIRITPAYAGKSIERKVIFDER